MFVPLRIGDGQSDSGPRLGGRSPHGVTPSLISKPEYFLTIPFNFSRELMEISIFISSEKNGLYSGNKKVHSQGDLFQVVVHQPSSRGSPNQHLSRLSEHPLIFGSPYFSDGPLSDLGKNELIYPDHKLGGYPTINDMSSIECLRMLFATGYTQLIQIGTASAEDCAPSGSWPFGAGAFCVFGMRVGETSSFEWKAFWEM